MKNILKTGTLCALILCVGGLSAQARGGHDNDEALAALGGFIGGVIFSEAIHDHHDRRETYIHYEKPKPRQSCEPRYAKGRFDQPAHCRDQCGCGGGHWQVVERRVYVPVSYTWVYNSCGVKVRTRTGGCFKTVKERIWIGHQRRDCRFG
ncbi:hypothetical protein [Cerasicoccus frondis]|uniref:hypothetical protein n=1 Tax=Cerasicoccus frondis TaxID=490090 RepID=UPI002852ACC5|nr:hypothetical protein [Cerasicoccus frondis]